jgi:hypothetical protein
MNFLWHHDDDDGDDDGDDDDDDGDDDDDDRNYQGTPTHVSEIARSEHGFDSGKFRFKFKFAFCLRRFNMFQYVLRCFKMFQVIARFSHECPRAHPKHASSPLPCGVRVQSETKDITIECKQLIQDRALPEKEKRQILCVALVAEIRSPNLVIDDD